MTTSWCSNKAARKVIPGLLNRGWDAFLHTKKYICIWSRGSWLTPKKEAEEEEEEETTKVWSQWKETTLRVECTQAALWLDSRRMTKKEPNHLKSQDHCGPSYFLLQAHSPRPEGVFSWPTLDSLVQTGHGQMPRPAWELLVTPSVTSPDGYSTSITVHLKPLPWRQHLTKLLHGCAANRRSLPNEVATECILCLPP